MNDGKVQPMDSLPPLASLIAFDAVYRTGSVTKAAALLGRTHSAISKQLHQLQNHAGVTIFEKSGSGIKLTEEGRAFALAVAESLQSMRKAYEALCDGDHHKVIIKVSSTFARLWAVPTVARFNLDHPDIEIQINLTLSQSSDELDREVDLVISWDCLTRPMIDHPSGITLGDLHIGPVLSPGYPHKLEGDILSFDTRINRRGFEMAWARWSDLSGISVHSNNEVIYDLSALSYEAAERALGVAIAPSFLIERELSSGSLMAPAGFLTFEEGLYVRPSTERPKPNKSAQIFMNWLEVNGRLGDDGFLTPSLIEPTWG